MNLGIDLGRTVVCRENNNKPFDDCFNVIRELTHLFNNSFVISRVNSAQREKSIEWLKDNDFYNQTGINKDNVYFCFERRDKNLFVNGLNIGIFIDDRPDVLIPMKDHVKKILFNPFPHDLEKERFRLEKVKNLSIVYHWREIREILIGK